MDLLSSHSCKEEGRSDSFIQLAYGEWEYGFASDSIGIHVFIMLGKCKCKEKVHFVTKSHLQASCSFTWFCYPGFILPYCRDHVQSYYHILTASLSAGVVTDKDIVVDDVLLLSPLVLGKMSQKTLMPPTSSVKIAYSPLYLGLYYQQGDFFLNSRRKFSINFAFSIICRFSSTE